MSAAVLLRCVARFYTRHKKAIVVAVPVAGVVGTLLVVVERHENRDLSTTTSDEIASSKRFLKHLLSSNDNNNNYDIHASNLETYGVTILRNVLSNDNDDNHPATTTIQMWQQRVRKHCTPLLVDNNNNKTSVGGGSRTPPGAVNLDGRIHFYVAPSVPFHHELARLGGERWEQGKRIRSAPMALSPMTRIVQQYFGPKVNYGLTHLQLLNALPGSTHQIWHRDNTHRGITAIVALTPIFHAPTEVILSSHNQTSFHLFTASMKYCTFNSETNIPDQNTRDVTTSIVDSHDPAFTILTTRTQHHHQHHLLACLDAGDAILYDSRCLHRGRGWTTAAADPASYYCGQTDRPVLILRWDADRTPPPGAGMIPTAIARYGGFLLSLGLYTSRHIVTKLYLGKLFLFGNQL